jgi:cellulose synthase/poly-beta-1,6-N-acetylglucosamine synthase-like glycosyltransferase
VLASLTTVFGAFVALGSLALLIPSSLLFLQVLRASKVQSLSSRDVRSSTHAHKPFGRSLAVLIPAHNEELGIAATLASIQAQMRAGNRLLVVADNCSDQTAAIARATGAEVIERHHATHRGKGYALDFGIRHLAADPPDVVVIVDADCRLDEGSLQALACETAEHQRPTQALYLMHAPPGANARQRLAAFAWVVKNQVRPLGGRASGWPCQLMGSGMGFLFSQLRHAPVASGNIVEDMQLGMDLAALGQAPRFVPAAVVHSDFPSGEQAGHQQRTRWEHGHLATISAAWRRWGFQALKSKTPGLLPMLLDLSVPPLALMVMIQVSFLALATVGGGTGLLAGPIWVAVGVLSLSVALTFSAVLIAWSGFGRHLLSGRELLTMPAYALRKIPLYATYLVKKQTSWIRTTRDAKSVGKP